MELDDLLFLRHDLTGTHLAAAILARSRASNASGPFKLIEAQLSAIATVIHSYSAIETAVHRVGHELLVDKSCPRYIPDRERDVALQCLANRWPRSLSLLEKLRFVIAFFGRDLDAHLEVLVRELGILRNWLVHGLIYDSTYLVSPIEEGALSVLDREDSVDWEARFPNAKFQSLDLLGTRDADTALGVLFKTLIAVAEASGQVFVAHDLRSYKFRLFLINSSSNAESLVAALASGDPLDGQE